jgi:hypothetical protein
MRVKLFLLLLISNITFSQIVINEIDPDTPSTEHIFVSGITNLSKVEIFSMFGTKVFEKTVNEDQIIPISFQAGMYFVKINTNDKQIIKKIIVK